MTFGKLVTTGDYEMMTGTPDKRTRLQRDAASAVENGVYRRNGHYTNQAPCSADALADAIKRYTPAGTEVEVYANGVFLSLDGDSIFVPWYYMSNIGYKLDLGAASWLTKADAETLEEWAPPVPAVVEE